MHRVEAAGGVRVERGAESLGVAHPRHRAGGAAAELVDEADPAQAAEDGSPTAVARVAIAGGVGADSAFTAATKPAHLRTTSTRTSAATVTPDTAG